MAPVAPHQSSWLPAAGSVAPPALSAAAAAAQAIADRLSAQAGSAAGPAPQNGNAYGYAPAAVSQMPPEAGKRKKWDSR